MTHTPDSEVSAHDDGDHAPSVETASTTPADAASNGPAEPSPAPTGGAADMNTASDATASPVPTPAGAPAAPTAPTAAVGTGSVAPGTAFGPSPHAGTPLQPAAPVPAAPSSSRSGGLIAGIAIGAIIGGLVGGGAAAVVASNVGGPTVVQSTGGSLTLTNEQSATAITGVAAVATPSVVTLQVASPEGNGSGSGVIYSEDGYIITNAHVATLGGATADPTIRVRMSDGTIFDGTLIGSDPFADIAVVKIQATGLSPIAVADSDDLNVGDLAVAIGAPLNLSNTVTSGVVSALNRGISIASSMVPEGTDDEVPDDQPQEDGGFPWDFRFETPENERQAPQQPQQQNWGSRVAIPVLQTDASINPGNSGGALLNVNAELIGINVALASNDTSAAAGSDGLGFAIPSNFAVRVADALIAGERPSHGLLGVSVQEAAQDTDEDAKREGGLIAEVVPGGAADRAGLRAGDVITAVGGVPVNSSTAVSAMVRYFEGGSDVEITYSRGGKLAETTVTLGTLEW